jgi:hypothetical protein
MNSKDISLAILSIFTATAIGSATTILVQRNIESRVEHETAAADKIIAEERVEASKAYRERIKESREIKQNLELIETKALLREARIAAEAQSTANSELIESNRALKQELEAKTVQLDNALTTLEAYNQAAAESEIVEPE